MANEQISLPYLIIILVISGLIIRYLFSSSRPTPSAMRQQSREAMLRTREAAVERIQQMFPQVDRRSLLWDLQRNGGNVQATTERILAGRLEAPPITFQPPPPSRANTPVGSGSQAPQAKQAEKPAQPDLITRYKLQDRLEETSPPEAAEGGKAASKGWSSNRDERQALLQRRRDEMILAARRKMEAKIVAEKAGAS